MSTNDDEVTREEVIEHLEQFQDGFKKSLGSKSLQLKALISGASSLGLLSSFFLGRKSGRKKKSSQDSDTKE